uniref:Uncharacterized protein n=1 Tax=Cyberlindnera jadinii TaxID=4903 RepID=S5TNN0_CYBJA|nr:hypothetical protein [Cyberlindnera jadinii]AGS44370.1 hypothetical protein [Cyberlindnera jadinii]
MIFNTNKLYLFRFHIDNKFITYVVLKRNLSISFKIIDTIINSEYINRFVSNTNSLFKIKVTKTLPNLIKSNNKILRNTKNKHIYLLESSYKLIGSLDLETIDYDNYNIVSVISAAVYNDNKIFRNTYNIFNLEIKTYIKTIYDNIPVAEQNNKLNN